MALTHLLEPLDPGIADAELAARVARGDEPAIRLLMRRYNQTLYRTARSILRDDAEAEDAVQEAYLKAIGAISAFRSDSRLGTWLVRIVVNESLGRLRKTRRGAEIIRLDGDMTPESPPTPDHPDAAPTPERQALQSEARRIIEARIDELPDAFRTVFVLRALEEMSVEEAATALGIPEATVRTRFFRARGMLRESLSRSLDLALDDAFSFAGERCDRIVAGVMERLSRTSLPPV